MHAAVTRVVDYSSLWKNENMCPGYKAKVQCRNVVKRAAATALSGYPFATRPPMPAATPRNRGPGTGAPAGTPGMSACARTHEETENETKID